MSDPHWPTTVPDSRQSSGGRRVSLHDALAPGTRLDEFEILSVLGIGAFGIVYLAYDHVLVRRVAIKEYMPAALAGRRDEMPISLRSAEFADTFERGLDSFLSEARLLASFDHPNLVKVHRFWKANGTAYMAMQQYPGETLQGRALADELAAGRSVAARVRRAAARRARAPARPGRVPSRHLARQHPDPARRPAGAARLRIRAARHRQRLAIPERSPEAAVRAGGAIRERQRDAPRAVDGSLRARCDAVLRADRSGADAVGGARPRRRLAGPRDQPRRGVRAPAGAAARDGRLDAGDGTRPSARATSTPCVAPCAASSCRRCARRGPASRTTAASLPMGPTAPRSTTMRQRIRPTLRTRRQRPSPAPRTRRPAPIPASEVAADPVLRARSARDVRMAVALALLGVLVFAGGAWMLNKTGPSTPALASLAAAFRSPASAPAAQPQPGPAAPRDGSASRSPCGARCSAGSRNAAPSPRGVVGPTA